MCCLTHGSHSDYFALHCATLTSSLSHIYLNTPCIHLLLTVPMQEGETTFGWCHWLFQRVMFFASCFLDPQIYLSKYTFRLSGCETT